MDLFVLALKSKQNMATVASSNLALLCLSLMTTRLLASGQLDHLPHLPISFDKELTPFPIGNTEPLPLYARSSADDVEYKKPSKQIIYDMYPLRDFDTFDPRSPRSTFEFNTNFNLELDRLDNGIFLRDGKALQVSTWFNRYVSPIEGGDAALSKYEFVIETKKSIKVEHDERIVARERFSADSLNLLPHPYPDELVVNPYDDVRLAASHFFMADKTETGIAFHIFATEQGIWGGYFRILFAPIKKEQNYQAFQIYRRLGDRPHRVRGLKSRYFRGHGQFTLSTYPHKSKHGGGGGKYAYESVGVPARDYFGYGPHHHHHYDEHGSDLIDATIEYDRKHGVAHYYLGNKLVWTIDRIGAIKQDAFDDGKNRLLAFSPGIESIVSPKHMWFFPFGNSHQIDVADPNKALPLRENVALVRAVAAHDYYGPEMQFWDESSARNNTFYGQGQVMTVDWFRVTKSKSGEPFSYT